MILVCVDCDCPMLVPGASLPHGDAVQVNCLCGAVYIVSVTQVQKANPATREHITKERMGRRINYRCPKCGGPLNMQMQCVKCKPKELEQDAT